MARKVLLHICCGPCAIYPVRSLRKQGLEVVGLFYNPNIHPLQEYLRRRKGLIQVAEKMDLKTIWKDDEYEPREYLRNVVFREASRCSICYHMRLERAWSIAKRGGFDFFTSTLLYSKMQQHAMIAELGRDIAGQSETGFLYFDFRQGWKEGIEQSKDWGIYRQQYCGCIYSEKERYSRELKALIAGT